MTTPPAAPRPSAAASTVAERIEALDRERFVGRASELQAIAEWLQPGDRGGVLVISGEGGIGKSSLARAACRLAIARGYQVHRIDGRLIPADGADTLLVDAALHAFAGSPQPLLVLDTAERLVALLPYLQQRLLEMLPATGRVLVSGRGAQAGHWFHDGWEHVTTTLSLGPLDDATARALLAARGLLHDDAIEPLISWAHGLPLALAVGAETTPTDETGAPIVATPAPAGSSHVLLERLVDGELPDLGTDALLVAAIAPMVDQPLLAATLGDAHSTSTWTWLRGLSFVDTVGRRARLHDRLREILATDLARLDPARAVELRLRVADHLRERARAGEPHLLMELRLLIVDEQAQWGMSDASHAAYADHVRPGDLEHLGEALQATDRPWWPRIERWFREAGEFVVAIRDHGHRLIGVGMWATGRRAPLWADDDPVLGPVLRDAATRAPDGNVLVLVDVFDLTDSRDDQVSPVASLGNAAMIQRCGLDNLRYLYSAAAVQGERVDAFMTALGFTTVPDLARTTDGVTTKCWLRDHGPGGIVDGTWALVYASCGMPPPDDRQVAAAARVRDLLRHFHEPTTDSATLAERQALLAAVDRSFGPSTHDRLLVGCLRRGYLDVDASHSAARHDLFLSRSTYFRRLAEATQRVVDAVAADTDR